HELADAYHAVLVDVAHADSVADRISDEEGIWPAVQEGYVERRCASRVMERRPRERAILAHPEHDEAVGIWRIGSDHLECAVWRWTQRIGEPSGYLPARTGGRSKVVPTRRNFPSGESTAMVGTRSVFSCVLTVYRSGRNVSLPSRSTDISRRWSGPNECNTNSVPLEVAYASDLAVPLFPLTAFC